MQVWAVRRWNSTVTGTVSIYGTIARGADVYHFFFILCVNNVIFLGIRNWGINTTRVQCNKELDLTPQYCSGLSYVFDLLAVYSSLTKINRN